MAARMTAIDESPRLARAPFGSERCATRIGRGEIGEAKPPTSPTGMSLRSHDSHSPMGLKAAIRWCHTTTNPGSTGPGRTRSAPGWKRTARGMRVPRSRGW